MEKAVVVGMDLEVVVVVVVGMDSELVVVGCQ